MLMEVVSLGVLDVLKAWMEGDFDGDEDLGYSNAQVSSPTMKTEHFSRRLSTAK